MNKISKKGMIRKLVNQDQINQHMLQSLSVLRLQIMALETILTAKLGITRKECEAAYLALLNPPSESGDPKADEAGYHQEAASRPSGEQTTPTADPA